MHVFTRGAFVSPQSEVFGEFGSAFRGLDRSNAHWRHFVHVCKSLCVFLRSLQAPFFKLYTTYSHNYEKALEVLERVHLEPWFVKYCGSRNVIEGLLITPIQRIPRYMLLLTDLISKTPQDHPDYNDLTKSFERCVSLLEYDPTHLPERSSGSREQEYGCLQTRHSTQRSWTLGMQHSSSSHSPHKHLLGPWRSYVMDTSASVTSSDDLFSQKKKLATTVKDKVKPTYHFILFNDVVSSFLDSRQLTRRSPL